MVDDTSAEVLVRLLTRHQEEIFRHIFALLPNEDDARDVLQETSVALFRKFADYDPAKPFLPWAYRFAELEVFKQRERNQRGNRLLSRELIERLAREREQLDLVLHVRLQALEHCLEQLPPTDRELIQNRYQDRTRIDELVRRSGTSRRTLFRNLDRVRRVLMDCINRRTVAEPT
jgi:RNA polymerase sigma-70 factor, ECF subfamily